MTTQDTPLPGQAAPHSPETEEQRSWLRLLRFSKLGAAGLRHAVDLAGNAVSLVNGGPELWRQAGIDDEGLRALGSRETTNPEDLAWLRGPNRHLIGWDSEDYPALLRRGPNPPPALFVVGDPTLLWRPQIAVVGSRNPSPGGRDNATAFARGLARDGWLVSSGLADGVDAAAHRAALDAGQPTLAVVGTGPDRVYPASNRALAEDIAANGAIVSEFLPGTGARREHFPRRNRILAGLSLGTLVIEAGTRSGALITARLAGECGRETFAIPGSIHNPMARGCHQLIRQGAALVETVQEVVDALAPVAAELADALRARLGNGDASGQADDSTRQSAPPANTDDPEYQRLWDALGHDPIGIDALAERTGLTVDTLSSMLLLMELDGRVSSHQGRYARHAT
ncbi:MAG: DNA-processing protein DprA [Lysobacteraceae bacterium]